MRSNPLVPFLLFLLLPSTLALSTPLPPPNANHIFNTLHSSLRQWGSSLNHNGMSFFLATVPAGTQLYHGTGTPEPVTGMEWLAFEPEHALIFARERGPPGGGGRGGEGKRYEEAEGKRVLGMDGEYGRSGGNDEGSCYSRESKEKEHRGMHGKQHSLPPGPGPLLPGRERPPPPPNHGRPPLSDHKRPPPPHHSPPQNPFQNPMHTLTPSPIPHGYLHTYTPAHPLHLLYIDGLSAGKTSNGTLDTQDLLLLSSLLPNSSHTPGASPGTGMSNEYLRASHLCNLTHSLWANKISGFLRMEGGFEIILCDFSAHVNVSSIIGVSPPSSSRPGSPGVMGGWPYIQALTSRYDGIGGDRIMLDYENFVSVFAEQGEGGRGLALWDNDVQSDVLMPRLTGLTKEELVRVRDKVTEMVLQPRQREGRDWQGVVDLVVRRYSGKLHFLITDERVRSTKERFLESLEGLLRPFVDFGSRDTGEEIRRCVAQFVPEVEPGNGEDAYPLAYRAVHAVTTHICSTLISTHDITAATMSRSLAAPPPARALEIVDELVAYLQWTTWKECGTCGDDEVCWIPIWPMGELEDHKKPVCRNESAARGRTGYWGGRFFGPRPPPGKGEDRRKKVNGKGKAGSSWIARVAELLENLTLGWWS